MSRLRLPAIVLAVAIALSGVSIASAAAGTKKSKHPKHAATPLPAGFVGMNLNQPVFPAGSTQVNLSQQLGAMVADGVESIRVPFDWATTQPYPSWSDVPADEASQFTDEDGIPTRWGALDQLVELAAQRGLPVLPTVLDAPYWDGERGKGAVMDIPASPYYYGNFLTALVDRYGPKGTFWAEHSPRLPIEMWQIWNEPDIPGFWYQQPFEQSYVTLLEASDLAVKAADPTAKIVLAGMPNYSWGYLARIYKIHGARKYFDIVALHPYTKQPQGVITIARLVRNVMNTHGDPKKPMLITETGWTSSEGQTPPLYDFETTPSGQAQDLAQLIPLLAKWRTRLNLLGFYWYNWADVQQHGGDPFSYSGLFQISAGEFVAKPALSAFRLGALALEHCKSKGARVAACRRKG